MFADSGLEAGVEEIAAAAQVGIGTFYRHFPTKELIVDELVLELTSDVLRAARAAVERQDGGGLEQFLYATGELHAAYRGCLPRLWKATNVDELRADIRRLIEQLLAEAQEHERVRDDVTPSDIDLIFLSWRGLLESAGDDSGPARRRQTALTLAGLRPSPDRLSAPAVSAKQMAQMLQRARDPGSQ